MTDIVADGLMRIKEAADFLAVSESTVTRYLDNGHIHFVKTSPDGKRGKRIPRRAVIEFAERQLGGGWNLGEAM